MKNSLVVRRIPGYGWAIFDGDRKVAPIEANRWCPSRKNALALLTRESGNLDEPQERKTP